MKRLRLASISAFVIVGLGACKAPSPPGGFGVNLTIESSALESSVRSAIATATLHVTGDQPDPYATPLDIVGPLHEGKATFRYAPQVHAGTLDLHVDVFDGTGALISSGDSGAVALTDGKTSSATIVLGAPSPLDMGVADAAVDLGGGDLAGADLLPPPDLKMPKNKGDICAADADCTSGHCADGVCCDTACTDACSACNLTGLAGTCSPVIAGNPPATGHPSCGPDPASSCSRDGKCDGARACRKYVAGTACGAQSCSSGTFTPAPTCDGAGTCKPSTAQACAPYVCNAATSACWGSCTDNSECASPNACVGNSCGKKPNGATCSSSSECLNNECQQGYCCATACTGTCMSCGVANKLGTCSPVPMNGTDPAGGCQAGTGLNANCATAGCDGAGHCQYASTSTVCVSASCSSGTNTETLQAKCDGSGTCVVPAPATTMCSPYVCGANACKTTCASDNDCVTGDFCNGTSCVPKLPQGTSCGGGNQCQAGLYCTDGVCCNAASCGTCQACNVSGAAGTCQIAVGQNPHNSCPSSPTACQTSTCTAQGNCLQPNNTPCGSPSCSSAQLTSSVCVSGSCTAQSPSTCPNYLQCASSTACAASCSTNGDCVSGYYCKSGSCVPVLPQGSACSPTDVCQSGLYCVDGYCCNSPCTGSCQACDNSGSPGTCSPITDGSAPHGSRVACTSDGSICSGSCKSGACYYPPSTTQCRTAGCSHSQYGGSLFGIGFYAVHGNTYCSGSGTCPNNYDYCGKYQCYSHPLIPSGTGYSCYSTCTDDTHCFSPATCNVSSSTCQ